jgi:hypothetical protein
MTRWVVPKKYSRTEADVFGFIRGNLGSNVSIQKESAGTILCGVETQDVVRDSTGEWVIRSVSLPLDIQYNLRKSKGRTIVDGPPFRDFHAAVVSQYRSLGDVSQRALLPQLFENLVQISAIRQVMSPLRAILLSLGEQESIQPGHPLIKRYEPAKIRRYFGLLQDLGYVSEEGVDFVAGPALLSARKVHSESTSVVSRILGDALRQRYDYMTDILGWRLMVPYLRWSSAYYWKALEAERLPVLDAKAWTESHVQLYGRPTHGNPVTQLDDMVHVKIVERRGPGYLGLDEVFEPYRHNALENSLVREVLSIPN